MSLNLFPAALVDMASGVPLILLGLWVATLRPRRGATLAFAVFSVAFGTAMIVSNLYSADDPLIGLSFIATGLALAVAGVGLYPVMRTFPRPLGAGDRLGLAMVASGVVSLLGLVPGLLDPTTPDGLPLQLVAWLSLPFAVVSGAFVLLLAMRAARVAGDLGALRQDALMASALALLVGYNAGYWLLAPDAGTVSGAVATVAVFVAAAALWLRAGARSQDAGARAARNVALVYLGLPAAAMLITLAWGGYANAGYGPFGVARMLGVLLLAYGILRLQLLGLDVRVKWTIRQSTIAAAFIGVFFVVSEGAQQLFSESQGPLIGIAAAGALVFALAPLQRAAERLASAAVPVATAPGELAFDERRALFAAQVEHIWGDGKATLKERQLLEMTRQRLGLGVEEAHRLEQETLGRLPDLPRRRVR